MLVRALAPARLVLRNSRMFSSASTKADGLSNSRIAQLRGMSTKADGLSSLSVGELKRLLGARGVDFKDCLEKGELMSRESQISPLLWTEYIVFWMCGGRRRRRGLRDSAAVDAWRVVPASVGYERHLR